MNPIEIFKLAGKLKWVGELVDAVFQLLACVI
jgi:hypothetical protein